MTCKFFPITLAVSFFALLAATVIWPPLDLVASGWFYRPHAGFFLAGQPVFVFLHWAAFYAARALGIFLAGAIFVTIIRQKPLLGIATKGWLFLFLGLLLAPGLIGNVIFKDHWGRARPREVTEFGGMAQFSPALMPQSHAHKNGSFVSGDAAFGFYLPSLAYVVPPRTGRKRARRVFWCGMAAGALFGFARLVMGAHFLSDILFAALLMLAATAGLHAAMFGARLTIQSWREWFCLVVDRK